MKQLQIEFPWKFLAIVLFFSCDTAKKNCKAGEKNNASQHFYVTARRKCKII